MKKLFLLFTALFALASGSTINQTSKQIDAKENITEIKKATPSVTFGQMYNFLINKDAHYTWSDKFIKDYQQEDGGYIDLAKKLGKTVDKSICEPDQHWHFFESWCKPSIDEGTLKFTANGSRGYNFSCPELLLWVMEACGAPQDKLEEVYNTAVAGKQAGTKVATICGNMRNIIPFTDVAANILAGQPDPMIYHVTPAVDTNKTPVYTMSSFDYDGYEVGENIEFTVTLNDSTKEIKSVTGNDVTITNTEGTYSFTMPATNVDLTVTVEEKGGGGGDTPVVADGYKLVTSLDELIDGAKVIIGTPGSFKRNAAISTTQNANNRTSINMTYDNGYYSVSSTQTTEGLSLCIFTISQVEYQSKTYYQFFDSVNNGYLYVASSSANYLRTQASNNVNGYFEITNNNGVMNIIASASSYTRNTIGNYSSTFIGCGGGTTQTTIDLAIYSDVTATTKVWATSYMKIGDSAYEGTGTGLCKTNGLYSAAKEALLGMGKAYATVLTTSDDATLAAACARYEAWAAANGDSKPYGDLISTNASLVTISINNATIYIIIFTTALTLLASAIIIKKKRYYR